MSKSHSLLKFLRKVHLYLGLFISPALLFFALTGVLQTFSLHETTQGSSYKPPAWIATLAQLHKKQTTVVPPRRARPALAPAPDPSKSDQHRPDSPRLDSPKSDGHSENPAAPSAADRPKSNDAPAAPQKSHLPMKIFFLLVGLGLFLSTTTGIYMAYKYNQSKLVVTGLLIAGTVLPLLLLPF